MSVIRIPDDLHRRLEEAAVGRGETVDEFVKEALEERLEEPERQDVVPGVAHTEPTATGPELDDAPPRQRPEARTPLGQELRALRSRIESSEIPLFQTIEESEAELADRRGWRYPEDATDLRC
jgi:hypothetical protein